MSKLTLGSLFDGSGGFPLGGMLCGIEPLWASEIEPFPILVTTKRIPKMKHYGDISTLNGADLPPVDIISFGSPCTDMSVAGKRAGLDGEQSVLFYEAIRIIKEMRCKTYGRYPRYAVWENVPGAFSSNKGADFKAVLEAVNGVLEPTAEMPVPDNGRWPYADFYMGNGWSVAYRTIDAQYFGVPQRRRRIYLVADFAGECAGEILFEREGVSRDFTPSGSPWQRTAGNAENSSRKTGSEGGSKDVTNTLTGTDYKGTQCVFEPTPKTLKIRSGCEGGGKGALIQDDKSATLGCNNDQTVFVPTAYGICSDKSNSMQSSNPHSGVYEADTSRTIDANGGNPGCNQGGIAVVALQGSMIGRDDKNGPQGSGIDEEVSFTLNTIDRHAVAFKNPNCEVHEMKTPVMYQKVVGALCAGDAKATQLQMATQNKYIVEEPASFYPQMKAESQCFRKDGTSNTIVNGTNPGYQNGLVESDYIVRRLTPMECARLQGFPDWWCVEFGTENPIEDEIAFWSEVWETHRKSRNVSTKPKSRNQIVKWLQNPHSDAAEYKMWGNGVALPCVCFVLVGIVQSEEEQATYLCKR